LYGQCIRHGRTGRPARSDLDKGKNENLDERQILTQEKGKYCQENNFGKRKILAREKSWQEKNLGKEKISTREKRKRQGYSWNQRHQDKSNERHIGN